jgi:UDP-2,3-diacylglucosamine hydrolase
MQLPHNKKIYFASDQHFGAPTPEVEFLENKNSWHGSTKLKVMPALFFYYDLFDFWFEYKTVVQKVSSVFWVN